MMPSPYGQPTPGPLTGWAYASSDGTSFTGTQFWAWLSPWALPAAAAVLLLLCLVVAQAWTREGG